MKIELVFCSKSWRNSEDCEFLIGRTSEFPLNWSPVICRSCSTDNSISVVCMECSTVVGFVIGTQSPPLLECCECAGIERPLVSDLAAEEWSRIFQNKQLPSDIPDVEFLETLTLPHLLVHAGLVDSVSVGKRMVAQNAVTIFRNETVVETPQLGDVIKVGKRKFVHLI